MRILHTGDWHLGKRLDFFSRIDEQKQVLDEICEIAEKQSVDLVIVAGDLFDTFNPPIDATELLYKTLKKLTRRAEIPVVAIAGNHDSPDRVNVADVLARENGIIFIGHPTDTVPVFETENGFKVTRSDVGFIEIELLGVHYPIRLLHTAFANEVRMKIYFGEDKQQSLQESLMEQWEQLAQKYCDMEGVNILTTHLYMSKRGGELPEEPEGEKPLNIGTADLVFSDSIPPQIQYVALGHLHRFQNVGTYQPVIYSGSPLAYSFSEAGQQKYVSVVEIEPGGSPKIEQIPLKSGRQLIRKKFKEVEDAVEWLNNNKDCLVELTMETHKFLKSEERKMLYQAHDGIIHLIPKVKDNQSIDGISGDINLNQKMDELFTDYFKSKHDGMEPNQEIMDMFNEIFGI